MLKHKQRIIFVLLIVVALFLNAWPVAAQESHTSAILNQDYTLGEGETLDQDLMVVGGDVRLENASHVQGNVVVTGGSAYIDGLVDGDVVVLGGDTELGENAVVQGDLVAFGQLRRSETSQVLGNTVEGLEATQGLKYLPSMLNALAGMNSASEETTSTRNSGGLGRLLGTLTSLALTLVVAILVVALMPDRLGRATHTMRRSGLLCLGVGLLTLLLSAILVPVLVLICIGIPVAIVLVLAVLLACLVGWVGAAQIVGDRLLALLKVQTTVLGETLAGATLLGLLTSINGLGGVVGFLVVSWGLGAVALTRLGAQPYPPVAAPAGGVTVDAVPVPPAPPAPVSENAAASRDTKPLDPTLVERDEDEKQS